MIELLNDYYVRTQNNVYFYLILFKFLLMVSYKIKNMNAGEQLMIAHRTENTTSAQFHSAAYTVKQIFVRTTAEKFA